MKTAHQTTASDMQEAPCTTFTMPRKAWPSFRQHSAAAISAPVTKAAQFAAVLTYYWLLCLADRVVLAPVFGYQGLQYQSAPFWTQMSVVALILLCTALTPVRLRQPSDGVLYVLLPLVVVPVLTVAATDVIFADVERSLIVSIVGAYLLLAACSKVPRIISDADRILRPRGTRRQPWIVVVLLSCASYGLMLATFGVHFRLLSFDDVYSVRSVYTQQAPGVLGYLLDWQAGVINPLFIVYGIQARRQLPLIAGLAGDFLIYSITGFKSVLFSVLAIAGFMLALRQGKLAGRTPAAGARISFAFAALVAAAELIDALSHGIEWTSLFVERMSLVVGLNTGYYFQYFSTAPKTHLAYGTTGKILGTTSAVPPPQQIAAAIYHTNIDPNVNLWADAYANFGHAGVGVFTLILAAFLWICDRAARGADQRATTTLLVVSALSLANGALFTCLLTNGLLLTLLVILRLPVSFSGSQPISISPSNSYPGSCTRADTEKPECPANLQLTSHL
jgi:hypothetical protein